MTPFEILESLLFVKKLRLHVMDESPVFILGYWRTGTTYLHRLMIQNQQLGYLNFFQSFFPKTYLTTERVLTPLIRFLLSVFDYQHPAHSVPLKVEFPFEEDISLALSFDENAFSLAHIAPSFFTECFEKYIQLTDPLVREGFKRSYLELVRKLSFANAGKRLVLKSPANYARISTLLELFPKAKFIVLRRNPYEVFPSNVNFWKTLRPHALEPITDEFIEKNVLETYVKMHELHLSQVGMIPAEQLIQIQYEELKKNPLEVVSQISTKFNITWDEVGQQNLKKFIHENHNVISTEYGKIPADTIRKVTGHWKNQIEVLGYETI
jgi:hypothetical protein